MYFNLIGITITLKRFVSKHCYFLIPWKNYIFIYASKLNDGDVSVF